MIQNRIFFKLLFLIISVGSFTLFSSLSFGATTIRVPADQPTIQAGIDVAVNGDTVLVADGTYKGAGNKNIDFKGKAITVISEGGAEDCIIDCEGSGRGFYFHGGEKQVSLLSGLTVKNGWVNYPDSGGGICCESSSPTIKNCRIVYNKSAGNNLDPALGGGISCDPSSTPTIKNCVISYNEVSGWASASGGAVVCSSQVKIMGSTIESNYVESEHGSASGGGISGDPLITSCNIIGNRTIAHNVSGYGFAFGGGISGSPIINTSDIMDNTAYYGGGVSGSPVIINSVIAGNRAWYGSGINCTPSSCPTVTNCTIFGNKGDVGMGEGIYCNQLSTPIITNSIVYGNEYGQIKAHEESFPTVTYSDVAGGYTGVGNIDVNPLLVGNGDYHLKLTSPCIDAGTTTGAPDTDIEGTPRPQGSGVDMGAYEKVAYPCPECAVDTIKLEDIIFKSGTECECEGSTSITIGPNVTIESGAIMLFKSPEISVKSGVDIEPGSLVKMKKQ